jgi:hypothetical protein
MAENVTGLREPRIDLFGYDPYDGLNAPFSRFAALGTSRHLNMAWIQAVKRSPLNLRPLLGIPRVANPKGLALLLLSHEERVGAGLAGLEPSRVEEIEALLFSLKDARYKAWGYGFPWQNRSFYFPRGLSNTVVSAFVGLALLKRFGRTGKDVYRGHLRDIADFFQNHLHRTEAGGGTCFSYSAIDRSAILNTSLLAAQFLAEYARVLGELDHLKDLLVRLMRFAVDHQGPDGSWPYGLAANQSWVDSFHTGYNLCALDAVSALVPEPAVERTLQAGCSFYERAFFGSCGEAYYYAHQPWPVDIHSVAQAVITLNRLRGRFAQAAALKERVIHWTMARMWIDSREKYAFQRHRTWTNRIDYNRWSQAWMHLARSVEMAHAR